MPADDLSAGARLGAVELLLREVLAFRPLIERLNIVTGAGAAMAAVEAEAALSGDPARCGRAAEQRVALERMTE